MTTQHRDLQDFTEDEREEWRVLMAQIKALTERHHKAVANAGGWMTWRVTHPDSADFALEQAEAAAAKAVDLWAEREAAQNLADATAYGAAMRADLDASIARRVAAPS